MKSHLVIGDSHAKPGQSLWRFEMLGQFAVDKRPDVIVDMGDWFDMNSLCSYDKGKASFQGRSYDKDIKAGRMAYEAFLKPIRAAKDYDPRIVALGGNHDEGRIRRLLEYEGWLEGKVGLSDLGHAEYGIEYVHYGDIKSIDGISYSHNFPSGVMGRPIGGEHQAYTMINKMHTSCTAAHSHLFDYCERTDANGKKLQGLVAGCFFEHNEAYAGNSVNKMWWRGLVICKDVNNGTYDIDRYTLKNLRKHYG